MTRSDRMLFLAVSAWLHVSSLLIGVFVPAERDAALVCAVVTLGAMWFLSSEEGSGLNGR